MKRRQFLGTTAATMAAISAGPLMALDPNNKYRKEIGIQLYTLRNEISKDVRATIKAVADAGYKQVEMYNFPDCDPMIACTGVNGVIQPSS